MTNLKTVSIFNKAFKHITLGSLFALVIFINLSFRSATGTITIQIEKLNSNKGSVLVSLYNTKESFPDKAEKAVAKGKAAIVNGKAVLTFKDLPYGKYAAAILHDANNNIKMDFNVVGIPKEGYGFSNDAKGFMGPPSFEKAAFDLSQPQKNITITATYFL